MPKLTGLEALRSQETFLKLFGIWPLENASLFYNLRYHFTITVSFGFTLLPLLEMPNNLDDYGTLSELLGVLVSPLVFCLKVVTFRKEAANFVKLLQNMRDFPVDAGEGDMLSAIRLSRRLVVAYPAWYAVSVTVFLLQPISGKQDLPVKFSYDLGGWKNLMYAYQVLGLGIIGVGLAFFDTLTINLINIGSMKLEILARKIKRTSELKEEMVEVEFKEIVDDHNGLIQYMFYVERVFTYCFLAQFFNSITAICNIALQLTYAQSSDMEFAAMAMYFFAMLIELALYCWFGNEVIVKSEKVMQACYECNWYEYELSVRKTIFIIMERSKRPMKLTAAKFATLSLQSFAAVIRSSYSYFTVMQRMMAKKG